MVVIPAGNFLMGSPETEPGRRASEEPLHMVSFAKPFAVGRYAVTRDEFKAFVTATGYRYGESCRAEVGDKWVEQPNASFLLPPGFTQEGRHPAVCISWNDASEYAKWLSAQTNASYRLLTEAEREYVTRAGTTTSYWWGEALTPEQANYDKRLRDDPRLGVRPKGTGVTPSIKEASAKLYGTPGQTVSVDQYRPNAWGIYQVHGNAAEWVQDCWNKTYHGAPTDGSAALVGDCSQRVLRGGGWNHWPEDIRAAYREAAPLDHRYYEVGFRVARSLDN
jgi:formylglycine-generating enzyme required for sulfatase activity